MRILTPSLPTHFTYFDRAKFLLAWRISLFFFVAFTVISAIYTLTSFNAALPSILVFLIVSCCVVYLHFTKNYKPMFWVYSISGTVLSHYALHTVPELTHFVDFVWMANVIFIAYIGLGAIYGILFTVINAVLSLAFFLFSLNTHIEILQPRSSLEIFSEYTELAFSFFIFLYLTKQYAQFQQYMQQQLENAYKELAFQNEKITAKNQENILLLKEVHHRVKNNLQIIISLLRLQKGSLPAETRIKFDEAIHRILTMSIIHRKLYQSEDISNVNLESYISELIQEISVTLACDDCVKINMQISYNNIGLKTIVPLGLMINELLSNSYKHAFQDNSSGTIDIRIQPLPDDMFELYYADSGKWQPPLTENVNFGTELLQTLTEQLEGSMQRNGSAYTFTLKNMDIN